MLISSVDFVRAQDCSVIESKVLCRNISDGKDKEIQQLVQLNKQMKFDTADKTNLLCKAGLDSSNEQLRQVMEWELKKIAPLLQKVQEIRSNQNAQNGINLTELDKLERLIKSASLFSYSAKSTALLADVKSAQVWNPNSIPVRFADQLTAVSDELNTKQFSDNLTEEMSYALNLPLQCVISNSNLNYLNASAKKDSPQTYHFKKSLLAEWPHSKITPVFDRCLKQPVEVGRCKHSNADKIKDLELENKSHLCVIKELFPSLATQLTATSLEIPSIGGTLVTEGAGNRPTVAEAKSKDFKLNVACPEDFTVGGMLRMAAGAGASFLTHEVSHEAVSKVTGKELEWNLQKGTWTCTDCEGKIRPIAIAGLASHSLSSEYLVNNQGNDSQFQKGWMFFNIFNTTQYFVKDWLARSGKLKSQPGYAGAAVSTKGAGDLRAFSTKQSYLLGTLMIGHQLYTGYRYLKNRQEYQCKKEW